MHLQLQIIVINICHIYRVNSECFPSKSGNQRKLGFKIRSDSSSLQFPLYCKTLENRSAADASDAACGYKCFDSVDEHGSCYAYTVSNEGECILCYNFINTTIDGNREIMTDIDKLQNMKYAQGKPIYKCGMPHVYLLFIYVYCIRVCCTEWEILGVGDFVAGCNC